MKKRIDVTQSDIDAGQRDSVDDCPIAIAASRCLGVTCAAFGKTIDFRDSRGFFDGYAVTPQEVRDFISAFDSFGRGAVKPMSFDLEVPNVN